MASKRLFLLRLLIVVVAAGLFNVSAGAQSKKPITRSGLLQAVKLNGLTTEELVSHVRQRGVDFKLTANDEQEFRGAGAQPELLATVRENYRPATATTSPTPTRPSRPAPAGVPAGPPLSKAEIVTMLQGGLASARVEQFVEVRGVSFTLTPDITREITAAGGTRSLLGAITEKATTASHGAATPSSPSASAAPDYDDYVEQATAMLTANDAAGAARVCQLAIRQDTSRPTAYQLLGIAQLYGFQDILSAERSMRAAIERGGAAVFRAYHDHDGFFNSWCQGAMFVSKTGVTYRADNGTHTFAANDNQIKETGINGFVGSQYGAFHIKVFQDAKKSKTYNFAPATTKRAESDLILKLIKGY